ncbi:MAG: DUF92 domain-containing protein [Thermoanaerobaculia bacterium]
MTASDWKRKAVHAGMGLFALTLRWLDWKVAALLALAALLFNLFVMPRIGRGIYRDAGRLRDTGIVSYAAMVLVLITLFRGRYLPIAAVVWAMMAFGDPAASIAGRLLGGPGLPWNREKTWIGFASNWAVGGSFAVVVFWFVSARDLAPPAVAILMIGSGLYAFLESVRAGIDDNIVAALPTALVMVQLEYLWSPESSFWQGGFFRRALLFLLVNAVLAFLTWRIGLVKGSGALGGAIAGFLIAVSGGWAAYAILWGFFLLGTAATKWGYARKAAFGVAQAGEGRRGVANVIANCAVPAVLLILGAWPIAFVAAFAAALADTLGTEIGGLYGRRAFSPLGWSALPVGTRGAISWPGTLAGLLGAAALGVIAALVGWVPWSLLGVVVAAGLLGSLTESSLNDLGRRRGFCLDHDFANALNTFVGAMIALEIALSLDSGYLYVPVGGI